MKHKRCSITLVIFSLIFLALAILLLFAFPIGIYPSLLRSQIPIKTDSDGQLTKAGFYWSKPPAQTDYYFFLFNVNNPDDITFFGSKPSVTQRGPYRWKQQDKKGWIEFFSNDSMIRYKTQKSYVYSQEGSCNDCEYNEILTLPNLSLATMARLLYENYNNLTKTQLVLADAATLLLGVYPFSRVKMSEVLYVGYTDGLLDFLQSNLKKDLESLFGNLLGFEPPDLKLLGYFAAYNHTTDGEYIANTGRSKAENAGLIQNWRNSTNLPFWGTKEANDIKDSTDGALSGSFLSKDSLKLFQSYLCRHFILDFDKEEKVEGINSYRFKFNENNFNPYAKGFEGYRFYNDENIDYYPNWNSSLKNNTDKIPLPPGMVQQKCIPGKLDVLPFVGILSKPHFLDAPPEIQQSIDGLSPNVETHSLGEFNIQPNVGSALRANVRTQVSIAVHKSQLLTSLTNSRSVIIPSFWLHIQVKLNDYAYDFIKLSTVTVPRIALYVGIASAALMLLCVISLILLVTCRNRDKTVASSHL